MRFGVRDCGDGADFCCSFVGVFDLPELALEGEGNFEVVSSSFGVSVGFVRVFSFSFLAKFSTRGWRFFNAASTLKGCAEPLPSGRRLDSIIH